MELRFDRITKEFGAKIAVDRVSAKLGPGVYGLLGANGAGKTTLMRMACGVLRPTSGEVLFNGQPIDRLGGDYRAELGYLPQGFGYYPEFTAMDFMKYMAALKGIGRREAQERSRGLLATVGLADDANRPIKTFSGGMKQRLGIAQAVLNDPKVLVLDEPTAGLDPKERVRFRNLIAGFSQDKVVLLSTHIVSDVEYIADHIFVMKSGAFVMEGSPEELVSSTEGKVWEAEVPSSAAERVSAEVTVANLHHQHGGSTIVRYVSDHPVVPSSVSVTPTLEDMYLYVFGDETAHAGDAAPRKGGRHA